MEYGIINWQEVNGGFSCAPMRIKKELNIKIRNFKSDCISREFCNPSGVNKIEFQKIETRSILWLYIDRDIYLTENGFRKLRGILFNHHKKLITPNLIHQIEDECYFLFDRLISRNDMRFDAPILFNPTFVFSFDGINYTTETKFDEPAEMPQYFKMPKTPDFEYY